MSIFADLDAPRVVFATEGRSAVDLAEHGGDPDKVTDTSSDMSTAFISGIGQHLPNARMTFDRYHLAAKLSEAIDTVRRQEVTTRPELKHTRWLWLKNWANLSARQRRELHHLMRPSAQLATARALRWRQDFQAFSDQHPSYAPAYLQRWCYGAKRSRLQPIKDFVALPQQNQDDHHHLPHRSQTLPPHPYQPNPGLHDLTPSNPLKTAKNPVITTAERLGITRVATVDRRHFTVVRLKHVASFALLPDPL